MKHLTGTAALIRLILRRDRIRLPIWLLGLIATVVASGSAVQGLYDTPQARENYATTVGSSAASIAMNGPPIALRTIGGITVFEVSMTAVIGVALMAIFLTIRHTRADEESGRTELLLAGVLGRYAPLAAPGIVVGVASAIFGLGISCGFVLGGLPLSGSLLYGTSIAAVGVVFTGVSLVAAQLTEHSRGAMGFALALMGATFLLRAIGDVSDTWVSWISPIGWSQQVGAFGPDSWWPLGLSAIFAATAFTIAGRLLRRRDIGVGIFAPKLGPADAAPRLAGPTALAMRLQRATVVGWTAGAVVLGLAFGSLGREVEDLVSSNEQLREIFADQGATIVDAYFGTVLLISALMLAGFTISSIVRLRTEETTLRAEELLATPLTRTRWTTSWLLVTAVGTTVALAGLGIGMGTAHAIVTGEPREIVALLGAALGYLPATFMLGGVAFMLFGWLPKTVTVVWAAMALCFVIGWLGQILALPKWALNLSPYSHIPQVPMVAFTWEPLLWLSLAAAVCTVAGVVGLNRRDIATG